MFRGIANFKLIFCTTQSRSILVKDFSWIILPTVGRPISERFESLQWDVISRIYNGPLLPIPGIYREIRSELSVSEVALVQSWRKSQSIKSPFRVGVGFIEMQGVFVVASLK